MYKNYLSIQDTSIYLTIEKICHTVHVSMLNDPTYAEDIIRKEAHLLYHHSQSMHEVMRAIAPVLTMSSGLSISVSMIMADLTT